MSGTNPRSPWMLALPIALLVVGLPTALLLRHRSETQKDAANRFLQAVRDADLPTAMNLAAPSIVPEVRYVCTPYPGGKVDDALVAIRLSRSVSLDEEGVGRVGAHCFDARVDSGSGTTVVRLHMIDTKAGWQIDEVSNEPSKIRCD
ncbi:MAG TPA: hypothetical protein VF316_06375 [Polyangiaceae bacterium]